MSVIEAPPKGTPAPGTRPPSRPRALRPRKSFAERVGISKSVIIGFAVALVLVGAAAFALTSTRLAGASAHQIQITFPSADGLVSGSDVLEAGSKVGYISDIQPTLQNSALVTIEISNDHWPLHSGLVAGIRPKSLLGEKFVDLHDGPQNAAVYDATQVLHAGPNADPVELDQFINSLDPSTRTAIRVLLDDLGAGVAGRGPDLNAAIATGKANLEHLAVTGKTLNNRDADLDKILVGLDGVLAKLTTSDQLTQMSQLITNGQNTLNDIEAVQTQFSRQFTDASAALADLNVAFDGAIPTLRSTLDIAPTLIANLQTETQMLAALGATVTCNPAAACPGPGGNMFPSICTSQYSSNVMKHINPAYKPCTPLWALINGLTPGPTTSGGALENNTRTGQNNGIFRICLALPTSPQGSCEDSFSSARAVSYDPGPGGGDAAFFAAFLGS
jgi:ABC-type transporter Mla subunit MlaD